MEKSTTAAILLVLYFFVLCPQPGIHSLAPSSAVPDSSYLKFVRNATDLPLQEEYDYIVVGGGTAGCPLATTLSANYSVLLLERGDIPTTYPNLASAEGILANFMQEDDGKTPLQRFVSEDGVANVRGRILGGTSMASGGAYSRADSKFYMTSGIKLDMNLVNKSYEWVEDTLVFRPNLSQWQSVVKDALLEAGVRPDNGFTLDSIEGTKISGTLFDNGGRRHGPVELLNKGHPKNLIVAIHATVERIIFSSKASDPSAKGIIYSDTNGRSHWASIRGKGEVILSAGAIGSPQLLLLSVVHPQPYVGKFMRDNPRSNIIILPPNSVVPSYSQVAGFTSEFDIESISGTPYSTQAYSIFPNPTIPVTINASFGFFMVKIRGPILSHGSLKLQSSYDAKVAPNVKFNYFAEEGDLSQCVNAMGKMRDLLKTNALKPFKTRDLPGLEGFNLFQPSLPMNQSDDASFCRDTVATHWHYHGGCSVGKVVDGDLRVTGIKALRVVDGSIFNSSPGTNPQATLLMLGRYVGLRILEGRSASKGR
ncbi:(R)-mandelonitrile lyase 2-like [Pyrus ussuriensis x Pyrus communis]|uniref:(R)-mandelonitrile lyase n=1 Tax=Pyrus ussuriensis x Pyrus communis TaxID=2448454 RepID=A0A5N5G8G0_9ROSA|nr:(R)-mandelonitrile lyase 2-like [Pyrus ussuriensis x Pyrus communis]